MARYISDDEPVSILLSYHIVIVPTHLVLEARLVDSFENENEVENEDDWAV